MNVTLRFKLISGGTKKSLYLDFYPAIRNPYNGALTRREFLKMHLYCKPKDDLEREYNRKILLLGKNICAKRLIDIQEQRFGFMADVRKDGNFIDCFKKIAIRKIGSNYWGWEMSWKYFESYGGRGFKFRELTKEFCEEYRDYMLSGSGIGRYGKPIGVNTAVSYFAKFRSMLKIVYKDRLLDENLYELVPAIKEQETIREFLTLEEFQLLVSTSIENCVERRATIFAVLAGLRYCDLRSLRWSQVRGFPNNYYIQFSQEKTDAAETFPIADHAYEILGCRGDADDRVFYNLRYSRMKPHFVPIYEEYQRLKGATKIKKPSWHQFFDAPTNIISLAKYLKKEAMYELLYRQWSGTVHGSDVYLSKIGVGSVKGMVEVVQLRHFKDVQSVVYYTQHFIISSLRLYLTNRIPEKFPELQQWYLSNRNRFGVANGKQLIITE